MNLSKSDIELLKVVTKNPGLTKLEISNLVGLSKGRVSIFIKNTKNGSYISEIKSEHKIRIHPTKLGKDLVLENILKNLLNNREAK